MPQPRSSHPCCSSSWGNHMWPQPESKSQIPAMTTNDQYALPEPENPYAGTLGRYLHILAVERVHELLLQGTEGL